MSVNGKYVARVGSTTSSWQSMKCQGKRCFTLDSFTDLGRENLGGESFVSSPGLHTKLNGRRDLLDNDYAWENLGRKLTAVTKNEVAA